MQGIEQLFFELLQVAIGTRKTLSVVPSREQWAELFALSKKQALVAIAFAGVNKLKASGDIGSGIDEMIYLKWLGLTAKVAQRNKEVSAACLELVRQYTHDGLSCCVLKGQGNLENYPEGLRECRTPGDIDVWCSTADPSGIDIAVSDLDGKGAHYEKYHGKQAVVEYVKMLHRIAGTEPLEGVRYHHIDAPSLRVGSGQAPVEVEAHFRPLFLDSPLRNCRLQRWFRENEQFGVHDAVVGVKMVGEPVESTKTGKTPEGIVSNEVSEIDSKLSSSVSSLSTDSLAASYIPSGNKPKKTHSLNETDGVSKAKCFCDEGAGFVPDGGATPDRGCDGNVGLKMRACSQSQTVIGSTKSEASTTGRGFSGFCQNRIPIPTVSFNAVYQLCHIYRHLFDEGIGLRQLLDYYFVLRALHIEQGELADRTESMAQWAEGMGIAVKSNEEIMHTLGRFGMRKFAGAVMWVLTQVFDPRGDKTKTINTPDGSVSVAVSENSSELDLSVTASSTDSVADPVQPSGDKQEINHSSVVSDWQKRWPWMICEPNEKEGRFLLNEIMMAGNFGKYDERVKRCYRLEVSGYGLDLPIGMVHAIEKTKHNLRLLTHYPEEVLSEPFFRLYHWIWRRFELWRY